MSITNNTHHNALFTKKNETRFVDAFERLVEIIEKAAMDPDTKAWLEMTKNQARQEPPSKERDQNALRIQTLERQCKVMAIELREANAKLSRRF
jgi:hypothetical protein